MFVRSPTQRPMKKSVFFFDPKIVDAGVPEFHEP
jgi:hypothetical protein